MALLGLAFRGGPTTQELRRLLVQRGVDTAGIFERDELVRLVHETNHHHADTEIGGRAMTPPEQALDTMHVQDVMEELDTRGVYFDVLTPTHVLFDLLQQARSDMVPQASRGSSSSDAPPADDFVVSVGSVWDAAEPAWNAARHDVIPFVTGTVGAAVERIKPMSTTAAAVTTGSRARLSKAVRARLRGLHLPPKPIMLAVCIGALRFGIIRTALTAVSLKLALDIVRDAGKSARIAYRDKKRSPLRRWAARRGLESDNDCAETSGT